MYIGTYIYSSIPKQSIRIASHSILRLSKVFTIDDIDFHNVQKYYFKTYSISQAD